MTKRRRRFLGRCRAPHGVEVKLSLSLSSRFLSPAAGPLRAERRQSAGFWCRLGLSEAALAALDAGRSPRLVRPLVSCHMFAFTAGLMTSFLCCIRLLFFLSSRESGPGSCVVPCFRMVPVCVPHVCPERVLSDTVNVQLLSVKLQSIRISDCLFFLIITFMIY